MKIYVLGNSLLEEDSLPMKLLPRIRASFPKTKFIEFDPTEEFPEEEKLVLIDIIEGLQNVRLFEDLDKIQSSPKYSVHDFDLGFQLKLMKKVGKLKEVKIIGVGQNMSEEKAIKELEKIIPNLL